MGSKSHSGWPQADLPETSASGLPDLVNRLAQELAEARRALTAAQQRLGMTSRSLLGRTQELTRARDALAFVLATQLAQVKDPERFLAEVEERQTQPEGEYTSLIELTDGRLYEFRVAPQYVRGKAIGSVTSFQDVTERQRLARLAATQQPGPIGMTEAEAKASVW
jgi:PAS domain-containing protein